MKYIIILGDGMADYPVARLGGKTPLQVAKKPNIDWIAAHGRCGLFQTVEPDMPPGSEVANLAVMGYNAKEVYQGRGVLEAASMGVPIRVGEMAMRCNLICIEDGRIKNHSAGHISSAESDEIIKTLNTELLNGGGTGVSPVIQTTGETPVPLNSNCHLYTGVSYRHLFVGEGLDPALECAPPHDHPGERAEDLMIRARTPQAERTAALLNEMTRKSWEILKDHPVNQRRRAAGKDAASSIWLWSPGRRPTMWTYAERFGLKGAIISAVDLIRGLGVYAGLEVVKVEGATGLWDTNYEGKAQACLDALTHVDFCYIHVEAPDEAGHEGNLELKIRTIEDLDRRLVGPVLEGLRARGLEAVVAVLPDHPTPVELRTHVRDAVPFAIADPRQAPDGVERFDETSCAEGSLGLIHGDQFIRTVFS